MWSMLSGKKDVFDLFLRTTWTAQSIEHRRFWVVQNQIPNLLTQLRKVIKFVGISLLVQNLGSAIGQSYCLISLTDVYAYFWRLLGSWAWLQRSLARHETLIHFISRRGDPGSSWRLWWLHFSPRPIHIRWGVRVFGRELGSQGFPWHIKSRISWRWRSLRSFWKCVKDRGLRPGLGVRMAEWQAGRGALERVWRGAWAPPHSALYIGGAYRRRPPRFPQLERQ